MRPARRVGEGDRTAEPSNPPRATLSAKPQMLSALEEETPAREHLGTVGAREAVRRAAHAPPVASIDEAACTLCGACPAVCPTEAITLGETAFKVNPEACCGCGACVEVCPMEAVKLS
jgi:MinD superfamily P-loop ATPase